MVGVLSIDFDYFIAASTADRDLYFPHGGDEIPMDKLRAIWKERYLQYPQLREIGIIGEFYAVKNFLLLTNIKKENFFRSNNHKSIKVIIDAVPKQSQLRIVNIDFHHDFYHYYNSGNYCNCGNWLRSSR